MRGLDLGSLEIFRAVATEGSVSKAAEKLNRVQSNVSTRIKQLEQSLQKSLFQRRNRRLVLTPDGHVLLSYADRLLRLAGEASEALAGDRPGGTFRIGTMESTAAGRLPAVLSRYHALYPEVTIALETDVARGLVDRLLSYDVEVAFIAEPVAVDGIRTRPVFTEELVLVVPESFPPIDDAAQVSGRTMIAFEQGCAYRRYLEDWLLEAGVVPGGTIAVGSYLAILAHVSAGTGFAVVPQCVLDTVSSAGRFQCHRLPERLRGIRTLLAWRDDYGSAKLEALNGLLPAA